MPTRAAADSSPHEERTATAMSAKHPASSGRQRSVSLGRAALGAGGKTLRWPAGLAQRERRRQGRHHLDVARPDDLGQQSPMPALASVVLSFARWELGGLDTIEWIGVENYVNVFTNYPPFWPAIQNNMVLLVFLFLVPTVFGIFLAVLIDRELRGSRFYQTSYFLPVVLSLALIGFIWQLLYSKDQGLINAVLNTTSTWATTPA